MSTLTVLVVILISTLSFTATNAGRLERIEQNIKNIDLKLNAYSNDIFMLKNDVADTNKKLDLLLDIMNNTTTAHHTSTIIDTASRNDGASERVSRLDDLEITVQAEISRVRRAFLTEKKKISQQRKIDNMRFLEFADKLNDTLAILHDRHDTKWTLAASSINDSVVSVLGTVRDDIDNNLILWNQSIHDNLKEHTNTTLATLNVLNHAIGSWNDTIHESLNEVDLTVRDFINTSLVQYDTLANTSQTKLISSLTVINDTVRSMDYSNTLSNIVESQNKNTESILHNIMLTHNTVRLVHSSPKNQGRLEVYVHGQWGTVCDDGFDNTDATVVCKMLGYSSGTYKDKAYFGEGYLPIIMDDVKCTGKESSILECPLYRGHNCQHKEDVGVICS